MVSSAAPCTATTSLVVPAANSPQKWPQDGVKVASVEMSTLHSSCIHRFDKGAISETKPPSHNNNNSRSMSEIVNVF